jgi:serine/threonine protein kinase
VSGAPDIALKIQRRRYSEEAAWEIHIHHLLRKRGPCPEVVSLHESFLHDGHICMAFEKHGRSLETALENGPLPVARVRQVTRQILTALERLHRCGFAHTDVKPDNILYDPHTGDARLADLGSATDRLRQGGTFGTREYLAPEAIIGAPLRVEMDMWSLGCTVFEMLTGRLLFSPRRAAARKYLELSRQAPPTELAQRVLADNAEELTEQLHQGEVVAEKYMLVSELGRGRFATVWSARALHEKPLDGSLAPLWRHAESVSSLRRPMSERDHADRQWRREKGAEDLLDLALNYEHLLLIAALCGPVPAHEVAAARYRGSYFEPDGALRFRPAIRRTTLSERLRRSITLTASERAEAAAFVHRLLTIDPAVRSTAVAALAHGFGS